LMSNHFMYICIWAIIGAPQLIFFRYLETKIDVGYRYPFWLFVSSFLNIEMVVFLYLHEDGMI